MSVQAGNSARTYMLPAAHLIQTDRSSIPWIVPQLLLVSTFHADMHLQQEQILLLKYTYWSIIATYALVGNEEVAETMPWYLEQKQEIVPFFKSTFN